MLNDFWDTAPPAYKYAVFGGMALTFLGIIVIIIGATTTTPGLTYAGLALIVVGMIGHMGSMMLRGRAVRKALKAAEKRP